MVAPLLILQTDIDGLKQFNETNNKSESSELNYDSSVSSSSCQQLYNNNKLNIGTNKSFKTIKSAAKSKQHQRSSANASHGISFDVCETISEQITTV